MVGVTACLDAEGRWRSGAEYWYLNRNYTRALRAAGAVPVLLCPDMPVETCLELCAGIVLSGGGDLPARFDASTLGSSDWQRGVPGAAESRQRIDWERALLDAFASRGRGVLGVCFGMQLMNLHFGGTLHTDLAKRVPRALDHGSARIPTAHALRVGTDSSFFSGWVPPVAVSSSHGQGVAEVAPGFIASAWAEDGVVEAIERGPLVGVEWHPESDASAAFVYGRWVERLGSARPSSSSRPEGGLTSAR